VAGLGIIHRHCRIGDRQDLVAQLTPPTNLPDELILALLGVAGPRPKALRWLITSAMPGGVVFTTRDSPEKAGVCKVTLVSLLHSLELRGMAIQIRRGVWKLRLQPSPKRPKGADN
jgi:hypothetical protein